MRRLLVSTLLVLAACPSSHPSGKAIGGGCSSRNDCLSGLVCLAGTCAQSPPAAASCPAAPGTAAISAGDTPGPSTDPGVCVSTAVATILPPEMVQDLGSHQVGMDVTFAVTPGTSSFVLFSQEKGHSAPDAISFQGITLPNGVVPTNVISPGGSTYYDDLASLPTVTIAGRQYPDASGLLGYEVAVQAVVGAFGIPNTSAAIDRILTDGQVVPGSWKFTVNDWARECLSIKGCSGGSSSGMYQVHAITLPGPIASTGTLDVEVYLAVDPTSAIATASAAASDPRIQRWVQSLGHFLANAGLCLGAVTFHNLPQWAFDKFAPNGSVNIDDDGPCGNLAQLFTMAAIPKRAVHLVVATEIIDSSNTTTTKTVGVDGSIPGPSGFPGTITGGAIVGLFDENGELGKGTCTGDTNLASCGTDRLAYIAAHEIGHWLGLYHTTEAPGTFFDPVSDTDRCVCALCAATKDQPNCADVNSRTTSPTLLTNDRCVLNSTCGGGRNLMFWLLYEGYSTGELSRDQGQIVRLNPAIR